MGVNVCVWWLEDYLKMSKVNKNIVQTFNLICFAILFSIMVTDEVLCMKLAIIIPCIYNVQNKVCQVNDGNLVIKG